MARLPEPTREPRPEDPRIRRAWWFLSLGFFATGVIVLAGLLSRGGPLDWLLAVSVAVAFGAAYAYHRSISSLGTRRRWEIESYARILQGLSRSVSPEAVLDAIVAELAAATDADHLVVVRRRPDARILEARLVSRRAGVPDATTLLPMADLEDPPDGQPEREPVAIPIGVAAVVGAVDGAVAEEAASPDAHDVAGPAPVIPFRPSPESSPDRGEAPDWLASVRPRAVVGGTWSADRLLGVGDAIARLRSGGSPTEMAPSPVGVSVDPAARRVADRLAARVGTVYGLPNVLASPLLADGRPVGAIIVSRRTRLPWPESASRLLDAAATEAGVALERAYSARDAETRAATDPLTGLPNRRYFDEFCGLLARRRRSGDAVGVLMIDIDRFKSLNDRHGHAIGDEVLKAVAGAIAAAVREDDVPARVGGEEFAVLLRNPGDGIAIEIGERIRGAVGALDLRGHGVERVSVSVGVAVAEGADEPIGRIVDRADRALYRAKRTGRDRVIAA